MLDNGLTTTPRRAIVFSPKNYVSIAFQASAFEKSHRSPRALEGYLGDFVLWDDGTAAQITRIERVSKDDPASSSTEEIPASKRIKVTFAEIDMDLDRFKSILSEAVKLDPLSDWLTQYHLGDDFPNEFWHSSIRKRIAAATTPEAAFDAIGFDDWSSFPEYLV